MTLKIIDISFDFTSEDVGEEVDFDLLENRLINGYIGRTFDVEDPDDLADVISDESGWLVNAVYYEIV